MDISLSVLTERDLIRGVAERWRKQYFNRRTQSWGRCKGDARDIYERLFALDPEKASAEDVNQIIGSDNWSRPLCDVCSERPTELVVLEDIENGVNICAKCLDRARRLLDSK